MGSITIPLPDELEKTMQEFKLDWFGVARKAIFVKAEKLKKLKRFSSKFKLSGRDVVMLADKLDKAVAGKFFKEAK